MAICNSTTVWNDACANGFSCLEDKALLAVVCQLLCDTSASGGGGGTGSGYSGNYGGAAPPITPTGASFAVDTSTGKLWFYWTKWSFSGITLS